MNTKVRSCLQTIALPTYPSLALLILRLIVGIAFLYHGWGKIQNPFEWMPGSPIPGFLQFLAAISEFGGGIALILGLLTRIASVGLAITMAVAVYMHSMVMQDPFVSMTGGRSYELAAVFFGIALFLACTGAGKFSLDAKIFGQKS